MKLVRRVSLLKGIERIEQPSPASMKMDRILWNSNNPYRLPLHQELYRFGYHNRKHSPILFVTAVSAFILGVLVDQFQNALMDNEKETLYRYKLRQREHSGILLWLRLQLNRLINNVILGNLFPIHELSQLTGDLSEWEQKYVRYQQYRYFMKRKSGKYDFLQLGVLEKFPYPSKTGSKQKPKTEM